MIKLKKKENKEKNKEEEKKDEKKQEEEDNCLLVDLSKVQPSPDIRSDQTTVGYQSFGTEEEPNKPLVTVFKAALKPLYSKLEKSSDEREESNKKFDNNCCIKFVNYPY